MGSGDLVERIVVRRLVCRRLRLEQEGQGVGDRIASRISVKKLVWYFARRNLRKHLRWPVVII